MLPLLTSLVSDMRYYCYESCNAETSWMSSLRRIDNPCMSEREIPEGCFLQFTLVHRPTIPTVPQFSYCTFRQEDTIPPASNNLPLDLGGPEFGSKNRLWLCLFELPGPRRTIRVGQWFFGRKERNCGDTVDGKHPDRNHDLRSSRRPFLKDTGGPDSRPPVSSTKGR